MASAMDFEVGRCTRRCAATDRELAPGETFYSALVEVENDLVRRDYSAEGWGGPPEGVIGWWKSHMPSAEPEKRHWAPNEVMLQFFDQLADDAARADVRYVLALLLVRRRVFRLEEPSSEETDTGEMTVYCARRDASYRVAVVEPAAERAEAIQEELARLLQ